MKTIILLLALVGAGGSTPIEPYEFSGREIATHTESQLLCIE